MTQKLEKRICICGCAKEFQPKRSFQKYRTRKCANKHWIEKHPRKGVSYK